MNKKDFRNMKQTQFDPGQVLKGSFSELKSSLRVTQTNPILNDVYTHFDLTLDSEGRPTNVIYYQGTSSAEFLLEFEDDVNQSLAGTFLDITEPRTDNKLAI